MSIENVAPCPGNVLELCAGIGGFSLGLDRVGGRTVGFVERDAYAAAVLVARMEDSALAQAPIWDDITTFDGKPWCGVVDTITAGFPCQPFSAAGQRHGTNDPRWIWPAIARIIEEVKPTFVFLENVRGVIRHGLGTILSDLAYIGFDAEWDLFRASDVGAPHKRERFFLLAHSDSARRQQITGSTSGDESSDGRRPQTDHIAERDGEDVANAASKRLSVAGGTRCRRRRFADASFPPSPDDHAAWSRLPAEAQPSVCQFADGVPRRLVESGLSALGNAVIPDVVELAWRVLVQRAQYDFTTPAPHLLRPEQRKQLSKRLAGESPILRQEITQAWFACPPKQSWPIYRPNTVGGRATDDLN